MKKKIFPLLITIILFSLTYVLIGIWGVFEIKKNEKYLFKTQKNLNFHIKYSNKIHHLRDSNRWGAKENEYLFSIINKKDFNKTLLLQGDSWIEQISENKDSISAIKLFSNRMQLNTINAGITSFAPSLMHVQYKILKKDFKIIPNILIIYIDQTDLGDEKCRYLKKKVYSNTGNLININREKFTRATFDYTKIYEYSNLYLAKNNFKTVIKFPYIKVKYVLKRNYTLLQSIINNGWSNRSVYKCGFHEIRKELLNHNENTKLVFQNSLKEYLNFLKNEEILEKILIVSYPHKGHFDKTYNVNVSDYIDEVLKNANDERIEHLNMSNKYFSDDLINNMYIKGDPSSHLKNIFHKKIFVDNILSSLKQ